MDAIPGRKLHAFAVDPSERWAVAGNLLGQVALIDIDTFTVVRERQAHAGTVEAVAFHPSLPYMATLSTEHTLAIWRFEPDGSWEVLHRVLLRDHPADNPEFDFPPIQSQSNALCFHPRERRLLTRNACSALLELRFDDGSVERTFCRGYFFRDNGDGEEISYAGYDDAHGRIIASGANGNVVLLDQADVTKPLGRWKLGDEALHMAEHVEGPWYLLASDSRRVYRFDVSGREEPQAGPLVTRDHLERVCYNRASGRAFVTSFDRNVYEVDPRTGGSLGVAVETPFKCRWLDVLERDPSVMIVQCRNGALYKLDLAGKALTAVIKETADSLWSAALVDDRTLVAAGEGPHVLTVRATGADPRSAATRYVATWQRHEAMNPAAYTKRLAVHRPTGAALHGRSDGRLVLVSARGRARVVADLGSPVRDLAVAPEGFAAFVACEDGAAHRVDLETGAVEATWRSATEEPLWALAYDPETSRLALFERMGMLEVLDATTMKRVKRFEGIARPKRARWYAPGLILAGVGSSVALIDVEGERADYVIRDHANTVEDFDWSDDGRFLAMVNYDKELALYDARTFAPIHRTSVDVDYPHGLLWLPPGRAEGAWPYELVTLGRSGVVDLFRVHDERLFHVGGLNTPCPPVINEGVRVR